MTLQGCFTCVKYSMFVFNFLFWLLGCSMIGFGIWMKVHPETFVVATKDTYLEVVEKELTTYGATNIGIWSFIGVGLFIMIVGFLGCWGSVKESQLMLGLYFVALFLIFTSLIGLGIYFIVMKEELKHEISKMLHRKLKESNAKDETSKNVMKFIQEKFDCCGIDTGIQDYTMTAQPFPCKAGNEHKPCVDSMYEVYSRNIVLIAGVAVGVSAVLFVGMAFSLLLCCAIKEKTDMLMYAGTTNS